MKIVDFVLRGNLPLKQRESYMNVRAGLRRASGEVFSLHNSEIGAGCAKGNSVSFIVRPHAGKIGAPDDSPFEMEDVRWIQLCARWLMMITEPVQPR
jgi:hypothetical protein